MVWFWLNVPLAVAFFGAICGIPLAKVLRNPDWGPQRADARYVQIAEPAPAAAVYRSEPPVEAPALAGVAR
jgi:hypothetical protein